MPGPASSYSISLTQHFALGRTHERYGHGGSQDEARTQMLFYPNHNTAIILLCSSHFVDRERLRKRVAQATDISISSGTYNYQSQINCASSCATDQDPLFAGAWEKSTKDQLLRRGLTTDAFNAQWQDLSDSGYRLTDVETWTDDEGRRRWDGIFVEGSGRHALWRNFNQDGFKEKWDEMTADGLHLIDLETYKVNGQRRWAGVWREDSQQEWLNRNQGFCQFLDQDSTWKVGGHILMEYEVYEP